jgi:hypothetical protein
MQWLGVYARKSIILLNNIIFRRLIISRIKSAPSSKDQAHLAKITEQNIHPIINTHRITANQRTTEERLADTVTNFSGRMYFDLLTVLLFGLIWIGIVTFLRLKKKKSLAYFIFFTIFYIYIVKVLDYTLFQFQSLVLLKYFMPDLILNGQTVGKNMNLIPLVTLTPQDLKTSLLNILLLRGRLRLLAVITQRAVIGRILRHLDLPAEVPAPRPPPTRTVSGVWSVF